MTDAQADIKENEIYKLSPELLNILLKDHTLSTDTEQVNIFWATDSYSDRGEGYQYNDKITIEAITGENGNVIVPRAVKSREQQKMRSRDKAEVFTPSWVCNKQNNLVDGAWFGRDGVFNTEIDDYGARTHSWKVNQEPVQFPEGKTWWDYVSENRMEITCGEAPYLASRYDTVTGEPIPIERRIGMLDRKLRIASENTKTSDEWLKAAKAAFMGTYGFEWQGDNIILARESLLFTFIDYYRAKFGVDPEMGAIKDIAEIISWNIWQMDGLKGVIPNSCKRTPISQNISLFGAGDEPNLPQVKYQECPGCKKRDFHLHNGIKCLIKDWQQNKIIEFVSLIHRH